MDTFLGVDEVDARSLLIKERHERFDECALVPRRVAALDQADAQAGEWCGHDPTRTMARIRS